MNNQQRKEFARLRRAGVEVESTPTFAMNNGSETQLHQVAKLLTARLGMDHGWRADCEVTLPNSRECDVLLFAPDRLNYVVELETNPADGITREKMNHYVHSNTVVDDMALVDITDAPTELDELESWVADRVGLW